MKGIKGVMRWYDSRSIGARSIITALANVLPIYGSVLLSLYFFPMAGEKDALLIRAIVALILVVTVAGIAGWVSHTRNALKDELEKRLVTISHARSLMDRVVSQRLADINGEKLSAENFVDDFCASPECIRRIVQAAYTTFEAAYGMESDSLARINFEVTFMTKSYRDNEITIPAAANRDGYSPPSMLSRKNNPKLYDNTITARIYREDVPKLHIISDASNPEYHEIYPRQKERIKSSIIYPVFSSSHTLLGTLVVHCDQVEFFKQEDIKFWEEILEIFSKRIALTKARMDKLWEAKHNDVSGVAELVGEEWF